MDDIKLSSSQWVSIKGIELEWNFSLVFFSPRATLKLSGLAAGLEWWRKDKTQSETTWIFEVLLSCCCSFSSTLFCTLFGPFTVVVCVTSRRNALLHRPLPPLHMSSALLRHCTYCRKLCKEQTHVQWKVEIFIQVEREFLILQPKK